MDKHKCIHLSYSARLYANFAGRHRGKHADGESGKTWRAREVMFARCFPLSDIGASALVSGFVDPPGVPANPRA